MSIKVRLILLFVPLIVMTVAVNGIISSFSMRSGMTRVATRMLGFKTRELMKYAANQWDLLVANDLQAVDSFREAAGEAVASYAHTLIQADGELIMAIDGRSRLVFSAGTPEAATEATPEATTAPPVPRDGRLHWIDSPVGGTERVGYGFYFAPLDWTLFVTEDKRGFFREVRGITVTNTMTATVSVLIALILSAVFGAYLTRPLNELVQAIRDLGDRRDFGRKVPVRYRDEIGRLATQYNTMTEELQQAYEKVKTYALQEALERRRVNEREYETLRTLGNASEWRDPETGAHIARVALYSGVLARALGESGATQDLVRHAAALHDIGKLGIPDAILLKPGRLSDDEFEIMKTHTHIAYEILKDAQSPYLRTGAMIALTHHEKYDGTGYPNGLSRDLIPMPGRIVALVDVFDALTSRRPYKEPWSVDQAVEYLAEQRGVHFDPELVDLFLTNIDEVNTIRVENPDP